MTAKDAKYVAVGLSDDKFMVNIPIFYLYKLKKSLLRHLKNCTSNKTYYFSNNIFQLHKIKKINDFPEALEKIRFRK